MKQQWENIISKIDAMSLRERVLIFAAVASILIALAKVFFLDPLSIEQKKKSTQMVQQQERMKALQAQIDASTQARQALKDVDSSPLHQQIELARQQLAEGEANLQGLRNDLVAPEKMAELLEQVLNKYDHLQLLNMNTVTAVPLKMTNSGAAGLPDKQLFKHEVQMTVRGSYLDLLRYLSELEHLPTQMFWSKVDLKVDQYPDVVLTLTVYTLSSDKTWLTI